MHLRGTGRVASTRVRDSVQWTRERGEGKCACSADPGESEMRTGAHTSTAGAPCTVITLLQPVQKCISADDALFAIAFALHRLPLSLPEICCYYHGAIRANDPVNCPMMR